MTNFAKPLLIIGLFCLGPFQLYAADHRETEKSRAPFDLQRDNDLYWISYTVFLHDNPPNYGTRFLMQIDSLGNVVIAPKKLLAPAEVGSKSPATALSQNGTDLINLWMVGNHGYIWRAVIDKRTLDWLRIIKTPLSTANNSYLKVTQRPHQNFIAIEKKTDNPDHLALTALGVSPTGVTNGASWVLSTRYMDVDRLECGFLCGGAVSADGRMAFSVPDGGADYDSHLIIQSLNGLGRPDGSAQEIATNNFSGLPAVSNPLPGGTRFVLYKGFNLSGPSQLFLQIVDAQTGQKAGGKILVSSRSRTLGDLAVDPLGRFVVFAAENQNREGFLFFQALDLTGHPSGEAKALLRKAFPSGIDLLKD